MTFKYKFLPDKRKSVYFNHNVDLRSHPVIISQLKMSKINSAGGERNEIIIFPIFPLQNHHYTKLNMKKASKTKCTSKKRYFFNTKLQTKNLYTFSTYKH